MIKLVDWGDGYWVYRDGTYIGSYDQFTPEEVIGWFQDTLTILVPGSEHTDIECLDTYQAMLERYTQ